MRIFLALAFNLIAARATFCCHELSNALSRVDLPSTPEYKLLNERWSQTSISSPECIVRPVSAQEVSAIISIITRSNSNFCHFAIKGGGHNPNPGANDINRGVTIDLSLLNAAHYVNPHTIRLGAGGTWQNAYDTFPDILFPGGVCGGTGIGGLTLGGGMSLLLPRVGFVANNVAGYEAVLSNGDIVYANATNHEDLYRALKGGGSNFAIITSIDLVVSRYNGTVFGGQVVNPADDDVTKQILRNLVVFTRENNEITQAGLQIVFRFDAAGFKVCDSLLANTDGQNDSQVLQPFLDVRPQLFNTMGFRNMSSIASEANAVQPNGYRDLTATATIKNDENTLMAIHASTNVLFEQARIPGMDFIVSYVPLPKKAVFQGILRGGDVLGLQRNLQDRIVIFFSPRWRSHLYDQRMHHLAQLWVSMVQEISRSRGTQEEFEYMNFAGGFQNPLASYGAHNLKFLEDVAGKYDPEGIFQTLAPGGFKLDRDQVSF